jgi:hypothetical protein
LAGILAAAALLYGILPLFPLAQSSRGNRGGFTDNDDDDDDGASPPIAQREDKIRHWDDLTMSEYLHHREKPCGVEVKNWAFCWSCSLRDAAHTFCLKVHPCNDIIERVADQVHRCHNLIGMVDCWLDGAIDFHVALSMVENVVCLAVRLVRTRCAGCSRCGWRKEGPYGERSGSTGTEFAYHTCSVPTVIGGRRCAGDRLREFQRVTVSELGMDRSQMVRGGNCLLWTPLWLLLLLPPIPLPLGVVSLLRVVG